MLGRRVFIDHLTLRVRDLGASRAFYEAALASLGVGVEEVGGEVVFGPAAPTTARPACVRSTTPATTART